MELASAGKGLDGAKFDGGYWSDQLLLEAAQTGEEWAFIALCNRRSKQVSRVIYRITKNRDDAEDALQDSILKAFLHLKTFDGRSSFATWFTRIGINSALMILRKRRARPEVSIDSSLDGGVAWQQWEIEDPGSDPEEHYVGHERVRRLRKAIKGLPLTFRSIVELRQSRECSIQELADEIGITVPAAKSRLLRARVALRRALV